MGNKMQQTLVPIKNANVKLTFQEGDHSFKGRRFLTQDTIKFGCPAKIFMSEVIKFPGYKVNIRTYQFM